MIYPVYKYALPAIAVALYTHQLAAYRNRAGTYLKAITHTQDGGHEYVFTCRTGQAKFIAFMKETVAAWKQVA